MALLGLGIATILLVLSALHVFWAAGGQWGSRVAVPEVAGRPAFVPSTGATLAVAAALLLAALVVLGRVGLWGGSAAAWAVRLGGLGPGGALAGPCRRRLPPVWVFQAGAGHGIRPLGHQALLPLVLGTGGGAGVDRVALRAHGTSHALSGTSRPRQCTRLEVGLTHRGGAQATGRTQTENPEDRRLAPRQTLPNKRLQATPNSLCSYLAPALGRGLKRSVGRKLNVNLVTRPGRPGQSFQCSVKRL